MVQREGCWVRQTEQKPFGGTREELGPCVTPATPWVQGDRLTRLVQECAAHADGRWQSRALVAWSRGDPWPERGGQDDVLQQCMNESVRAVLADDDATKHENEGLRKQLTTVTGERDALRKRDDDERDALRKRDDAERAALRARDDQDRTAILTTQAKLADHLGEAAKKAQQPASATATATSTHSSTTSSSQPAPAAPSLAVLNGSPTVVPLMTPQATPARPATQARARPPARKVEPAVLGAGCDPGALPAADPAAKDAAHPPVPSAEPAPPAAPPPSSAARIQH
jgi:hypothetical protein